MTYCPCTALYIANVRRCEKRTLQHSQGVWPHLESLEKALQGLEGNLQDFGVRHIVVSTACETHAEKEILAASAGVGAASEAVSREAQLLLAPQCRLISSQHWFIFSPTWSVACSLSCCMMPLHQTYTKSILFSLAIFDWLWTTKRQRFNLSKNITNLGSCFRSSEMNKQTESLLKAMCNSENVHTSIKKCRMKNVWFVAP